MLSASDDAIGSKNDLVGHAESDDLIAYTNGQAGKVISDTIGPLEVDVVEGRKLPRDAPVFLDCIDGAADCSVDPILRENDAPSQPEAFAQCSLPQADRIRVGQGSELVVQENLDVDAPILTVKYA